MLWRKINFAGPFPKPWGHAGLDAKAVVKIDEIKILNSIYRIASPAQNFELREKDSTKNKSIDCSRMV